MYILLLYLLQIAIKSTLYNNAVNRKVLRNKCITFTKLAIVVLETRRLSNV